MLYRVRRTIEKAKAQVWAKAEHPFRVIKRQFGYVKIRLRDLAKNTAQHAVCPVESMDGPSTFVGWRRIGTSVMRGMPCTTSRAGQKRGAMSSKICERLHF
ncbi:hypothetical protein D9M71_216970 [compost metagenome]